MSILGKRRAEESEVEIQPVRKTNDCGQLPDPCQLALMQFLDVQSVVRLGCTSTANATRLLGWQATERFNPLRPLFEHWLWRLEHHFGISNKAEKCEAPTPLLANMVAKSMLTIVDHKNSCASMYQIFERLINSFKEPIFAFDFAASRLGTSPIIWLRNERTDSHTLCSVVSLLAPDVSKEKLFSEICGPIVHLPDNIDPSYMGDGAFFANAKNISFYVFDEQYRSTSFAILASKDPNANGEYFDWDDAYLPDVCRRYLGQAYRDFRISSWFSRSSRTKFFVEIVENNRTLLGTGFAIDWRDRKWKRTVYETKAGAKLVYTFSCHFTADLHIVDLDPQNNLPTTRAFRIKTEHPFDDIGEIEHDETTERACVPFYFRCVTAMFSLETNSFAVVIDKPQKFFEPSPHITMIARNFDNAPTCPIQHFIKSVEEISPIVFEIKEQKEE